MLSQKKYLEKLEIINTQYAITKHTDRKHLHLHFVVDMVNNNGKPIPDSYLGSRGKKIVPQLTQQYNLVPAISKNLELTNPEALRKSEASKYKVYKEIMKALRHCKTCKIWKRDYKEGAYKYSISTKDRH